MPEDAEVALEPDLAICDPHHHLYPEDFLVVSPQYLVSHLVQDFAGHNVVKTIYVETTGSAYREGGPVELQPLGETEWVAERADDRTMAAIVGYADLMLGQRVGAVLDAHAEAARGRFRGIRYRSMAAGQPEPPRDFFAEPEFRAGAAELQKRGLTVDFFIMYDLIPSLIEFAKATPELTIVIDHLGMPIVKEMTLGHPTAEDWKKRDSVLAEWRPLMAKLAECENVSVKLGGIGMHSLSTPEWFSKPPTSEEIAAFWAPEFDFLIEQFGPSRSMFESNYPADRPLCSYGTLWNTFKRMTTGYSATDRAALFHDTAVRLYNVP